MENSGTKSTKSYSIIFWIFAVVVVIYFGNEFYKSRNNKNEMFVNEDDDEMEQPSSIPLINNQMDETDHNFPHKFNNNQIDETDHNYNCPPKFSTLPKSAPFEADPYNPESERDKTVNFKSGVNSLFIPGNENTADCFPKNKLTASDLLPNNDDNLWSQVVPNISNKNFLVGGANIGINTVGQVNRNANLQLRSEPPNPQVVVSPWQQSTIGPDLARLPLEIGCGPL